MTWLEALKELRALHAMLVAMGARSQNEVAGRLAPVIATLELTMSVEVAQLSHWSQMEDILRNVARVACHRFPHCENSSDSCDPCAARALLQNTYCDE